MSTPIHAQVAGTFSTSATLAPVAISIPSGYNDIELINLTDIMAVTNTPAAIVKAFGNSSMPNHSAITLSGTGAGYGLNTAANITSGFSFVPDSGNQTPGAATAAGTGITAATPAVITSASTAGVGDIMRVYSTTGMLQIAGWDFTNTTAAGATQTITNLPAGGGVGELAFAAPATSVIARIIPFNPRYYPVTRRITNIGLGVTTTILMNVTHQFTVGQLVRLKIPAQYGTIQLNGLTGTITAIGTALTGSTNTITLNINSVGMTAFTFPTSAVAALGVDVPEVVPVGEAATAPYANFLDDATTNVSATGVLIDTGMLVASKNYSWIARKGQSI
jgi:hypothetical protein